MNTKIIYNEKELEAFVRRCDNVKISKTFPCAVMVKKHSGMGHCSDWHTAKIVEPPNGTNKEQINFLNGVIRGWESS